MHLTYDAFFKKLSMSSSVDEIGNIEGFNFEWGNRYNLIVEKAILKNPPEDGSSVEFRLISLISKTKVDSSFRFLLKLENELYLGPGEQESTFRKIDETTYFYFQSVKILFAPKFRTVAEKVIMEGQSIQGVFLFNRDGSITMEGVK